VLLGDFFNHKGEYDLIIEQTFFCATTGNASKNILENARAFSKGRCACWFVFNRTFEAGPLWQKNELL
jgi:hypothetical protein